MDIAVLRCPNEQVGKAIAIEVSTARDGFARLIGGPTTFNPKAIGTVEGNQSGRSKIGV